MLLHLFCLSVEDTLSLPWEKREFLFSICVISLSFFTPVQSPWFPTGQTLITEWTFQKPQRQKRCLCDRTVQAKEILFPKKRQQESELTGFLTLLAIFSFYFLQDIIYHLNSSYKKCITTVPEDVTRIILHKREKKILWLPSHYLQTCQFSSIKNHVSLVVRGWIMQQICTLRLMLLWGFAGKWKKRKKVWKSKMSQFRLNANMTHDSE